MDASGKLLRTLEGSGDAGINRVYWDLHMESAEKVDPNEPYNPVFRPAPEGPPALPGKYTATISVAGRGELQSSVTVLPDPLITISDADRQTRHNAQIELYGMQKTWIAAQDAVNSVSEQMATLRKQLARTAGDGRPPVPEDLSRRVTAVSDSVRAASRLITSNLGTVNGLAKALSGYTGLPTKSQMQSIGWARDDMNTGIPKVNALLQKQLPDLYSALQARNLWPSPVPSIPVPPSVRRHPEERSDEGPLCRRRSAEGYDSSSAAEGSFVPFASLRVLRMTRSALYNLSLELSDLRPAFFCLALAMTAVPVVAQTETRPRDTTMINRSTNPLLSSFRFRSIGPASMGGRVDDIAVVEKDPRIIYIGYAIGGVFKSVNAGTTFEPVFESYGSASIGDLAMDPTNAEVVWVGTGEPNNRQTSSFGDGIYKSTDGGKTFTNVGLRETQTIARIVIDPRHPRSCTSPSPGHLFGPNPDRGVYKTTDGGTTWNKIQYVDENTGFTDIAMDPKDPNTLYAASYQRRRTGCCFNGGGRAARSGRRTTAAGAGRS